MIDVKFLLLMKLFYYSYSRLFSSISQGGEEKHPVLTSPHLLTLIH